MTICDHCDQLVPPHTTSYHIVPHLGAPVDTSPCIIVYELAPAGVAEVRPRDRGTSKSHQMALVKIAVAATLAATITAYALTRRRKKRVARRDADKKPQTGSASALKSTKRRARRSARAPEWPRRC